jgi:hypothetical protein
MVSPPKMPIRSFLCLAGSMLSPAARSASSSAKVGVQEMTVTPYCRGAGASSPLAAFSGG